MVPIIETDAGFEFTLDGVRHGTWRSRAEAQAGMKVERARLAKKNGTSAVPVPRVRKTPNGRHLYMATLKGYATYGWGNTPDEARAKLAEMIAQSGEKPAVARYA